MDNFFIKNLGKITMFAVAALLVYYVFVMISISNEIEHNGGLGKSIGKFINDINSEIK